MSLTIDTSIRASHYGATAHDKDFVVLHYTANTGDSATARGNANFFANPNTETSAHYIVDDGDVAYNVVPENLTAWAVGGSKWANNGGDYYGECTNDNSISIEMVSHTDDNGEYYIPEKTIENALELAKDIQTRHGISDDHVIRHYDVNGKPCPMCWTNEYGYEGEPLWDNFKERLSGHPAPQPTPTPTPTGDYDVYYAVDAGKIYPEVKNTEDYAGVQGKPIKNVAVRISQGTVNYRVHVLGGKWLPPVTGYDWDDYDNGYAGNNRDIDAIEIWTDADVNANIMYRVSPVGENYLPWVTEDSDYAGVFGKKIDRLQIKFDR